MEITLKFTKQEVEYLLAVLGKQPFEIVEPLIAKIREQGLPQVEASKRPVAVEAQP